MDALAYKEHSLSKEERTALERSEYFEDLMLLRHCDDAGRQIGIETGTLEETLAYLRSLEDGSYLNGIV